jgi:uncharacterized repeat protein (TIGR01451 family)
MKFSTLLSFLLLTSNLAAQFAPPITVQSNPYRPLNALVEDLNNDGALDIVVHGERNISWYEYLTGDSALSTPRIIFTSYTDNLQVINLTSGDFDQDGDIDFAANFVDGFNQAKLGFFKNLGNNGQFSKTILDNTLLSTYTTLLPADLDGDSDKDLLAIANNQGKLYWFENLGGDFVFSDEILIDSISSPSLAATADFDGDEDLDIAIKANLTNEIYWYRNSDGQGNFADPVFISSTSYDMTSILPTDIDFDGDLDIVFNNINPKIYVAFNMDGNGTFSASEQILNIAGDGTPILADMNSDGVLDLVSSYMYWFEGPLLNNSFYHSIPYGQGISKVVAADITGDGAIDLIGIKEFSSYFHDNQQILGSPQSVYALPITHQSDAIYDLNVFDMDGDSDNDIACTSLNDHEISWYENENGYGKNNKQTVFSNDIVQPRGIEQVDLDGDGQKDLLVWGIEKLGWRKNLNNNGEYGNLKTIKEWSNQSNNILALRTGDMDSDGDIDIVYISYLNGAMFVLKNSGNGIFSPGPANPLPGYGIGDIALGDMDNDGDLDVVLSPEFVSSIVWYENIDSQGTLNAFQTLNFNLDSKPIYLFDIDNNGWLDIVGNFTNSNSLFGLLNFGQIGSQAFQPITIANNVEGGYYPADIDRDGDTDIVASITDIFNNYKIGWLESTTDNGSIVFIEHILTEQDGASEIICSDIDSDQDLDIFWHNGLDIFWMENLIEQPSISGICYWDENENGLLDSLEVGLNNLNIALNPDQLQTQTNNNGRYYFYLTDGNYTIDASPGTDWEQTSLPETYQILIDNNSSVDNHFGFRPTVSEVSISTDLTSGPFRCNTQVPFWLSITNDGTTRTNATTSLKLDGEMDLVNIAPMPDTIFVDSINGDSLVWFFGNLNPTHTIQVQILVLAPGTEGIGDFYHASAISQYSEAGSSLVFADSSVYTSNLRCSYDPNDKQVSPDREGDENHTLFGESLEYTIRFQNTGNDTAFNITIVDYLDHKLDWSSFQLIASSHTVRPLIHNDGKMEFQYENILLPDSTTNEPGSHGFVKFGINEKPGLPENSIIENSAEIYFDFNPPIYTNTVASTMVTELPSATNELATNPSVVVSPNPFRSQTLITLNDIVPNGQYELRLYSSLGQPIGQFRFSNNEFWLKMPTNTTGFFVYEIVDSQTGLPIGHGKLIAE